MGPAPHQPRRGRAGPGRRARPPAGPLHPAGGDSRLPRPLVPSRGDRLGRAGRPLRRAGAHGTLTDRRAQPGGGRLQGRRARRPPSSWSTSWSRRSTLERYHLLYSVRGDLLDRLGRHVEAASSSSVPRAGDQCPGARAASERADAARLAAQPARRDQTATGARPADPGAPRHPPRPQLEPGRWQRAIDEDRSAPRQAAQFLGGQQPARPRRGRGGAPAGGLRVTQGWETSSSPISRLAYSRVSGSAIPGRNSLARWLFSTVAARAP